MARRRIFSPTVTESDSFCSMSMGAQLLYFHLNMNADDDGFVNCAIMIMRKLGVSAEEFMELDGRFIIWFEDEKVALIVHWLCHNTIKYYVDRKLAYPEIAKSVYITDAGTYTLSAEGNVPLVDYKLNRTSDAVGKSVGKSVENSSESLAGNSACTAGKYGGKVVKYKRLSAKRGKNRYANADNTDAEDGEDDGEGDFAYNNSIIRTSQDLNQDLTQHNTTEPKENELNLTAVVSDEVAESARVEDWCASDEAFDTFYMNRMDILERLRMRRNGMPDKEEPEYEEALGMLNMKMNAQEEPTKSKRIRDEREALDRNPNYFKLNRMHKSGKGVVMLSNYQIDSLLDEMSLDEFEYYIEKLADFIIEKGGNPKNHYMTIRTWALQDRNTENKSFI